MRYLVVPYLTLADDPCVSPEDVENGASETCVDILEPAAFTEVWQVEQFIHSLFELVQGHFRERNIVFAHIA